MSRPMQQGSPRAPQTSQAPALPQVPDLIPPQGDPLATHRLPRPQQPVAQVLPGQQG